jgi:hypothetical protein
MNESMTSVNILHCDIVTCILNILYKITFFVYQETGTKITIKGGMGDAKEAKVVCSFKSKYFCRLLLCFPGLKVFLKICESKSVWKICKPLQLRNVTMESYAVLFLYL